MNENQTNTTLDFDGSDKGNTSPEKASARKAERKTAERKTVKGLNAKGWLLSFAGILLAVLMVWAAINIYINPFGAFAVENNQTWWSYAETLNPRAAKISYLELHHDEYDSYILGSSSCSSWPVEELNQYMNASFYNLINYGMDAKEMEQLATYIIDNYTVKNLFVSLYIGSADTKGDYEQTLTYTNHYKVSGASAFSYYSKYLFADLSNAFLKLEKARTDSYIPAAHDCFDEKTGAYAKKFRDVEAIGSLEEYTSKPAYEIFNDYPSWKIDLPYINEMAIAVANIRELCLKKGINIKVVLAPVYSGNLAQYSDADIKYFKEIFMASYNDRNFYDFMDCDGCDDPRFFYDDTHFRNALGSACLKEMFEGEELDVGTELRLPVLMYHSVTEGGNAYSISPSVLDEHLSALETAGYSTISSQELIDWVNGDGTLPEKPILITFDDGYENNYTQGYPILKAHNARACIFAIGKSVGRAVYTDGLPMTPHFDLIQAQEMESSGLIDVQSHTYNMHQAEGRDPQPVRSGVLSLENETEEAYINSLRNDIASYKANVFDVNVLSYPEGLYSDLSELIFAEEGIEMTFCSETKVNTVVQGLPQSLRLLGRIDADGLSAQELLDFLN